MYTNQELNIINALLDYYQLFCIQLPDGVQTFNSIAFFYNKVSLTMLFSWVNYIDYDIKSL